MKKSLRVHFSKVKPTRTGFYLAVENIGREFEFIPCILHIYRDNGRLYIYDSNDLCYQDKLLSGCSKYLWGNRVSPR